MRLPPYTKAEDAYLQEIAGDLPRCSLVRAFNRWAVKHGYSKRSHHSINSRIRDLAIDTSPYGTWLTLKSAAELIGVSKSAVRNWICAHDLPCRRSGSKHYLHRGALVDLARRKPRLFGGLERSGLFALLEDEELVDHILTHYPRRYRGGKPHRVRCVQTGAVYPSVEAAATAHYVSPSHMLRVAVSRSCFEGLQFEVVPDDFQAKAPVAV